MLTVASSRPTSWLITSRPPLCPREVRAQPGDRVRVEVVGGLVEQHRLRAREEDARELDPPALAAGEGAQRLVEHALRQAQVRGDAGRLGLGGVAPAGRQLGLGPRVRGHGLVALGLVVARHGHPGLLEPDQRGVEAPGGEDAVAGEDLGVPRTGVLREVADVAGAGHGAGGGCGLAGQDLGQRRLAGPVAPDQTDLVTRGDLERRAVDQQPRARAHLEILRDQHVCTACFLRDVNQPGAASRGGSLFPGGTRPGAAAVRGTWARSRLQASSYGRAAGGTSTYGRRQTA